MAWDRVAKWRALDKVLRELMKIHMIQVWNKTKYSETYRNILKHCAVQVQNLKYSETIWNNLKHCNTGMKLSELFWNLLKQSENQTIYRHDALRTILKLSETRINIMKLHMMQVWNILKYSETLWNSPNHYDNSCDTGMKQKEGHILKATETLWNILTHSDTFWNIAHQTLQNHWFQAISKTKTVRKLLGPHLAAGNKTWLQHAFRNIEAEQRSNTLEQHVSCKQAWIYKCQVRQAAIIIDCIFTLSNFERLWLKVPTAAAALLNKLLWSL